MSVTNASSRAITAPINALAERPEPLWERPFDRSEYELRVQRTQSALVRDGLDCLMITDDDNFFYYTGYGGFVQRSRPRFVLIPASGHPVVLVASNIDVIIHEVSALPDIRTYSSIGVAPVDDVLSILRQLLGSTGRIGAELGYEQRLGMSELDFVKLKASAQGFEWTDAASLLWGLRMVKTPAELGLLRRANLAASAGIPQAFNALRSGMTEIEVSEIFVHTLKACGAQGAQCAVFSGSSGYARTTARPRPQTIAPGDMMWIDVATHVGGYWCDVSRAATIGPASEAQSALQRLIHEATIATIATLRAGVKAADVASTCEGEMVARGLMTNSGVNRYGHGIGINVEPPHVAAYDETTLVANMVITCEPEILMESGRFNVEEDVLITDVGHEILTRLPWQIFEV